MPTLVGEKPKVQEEQDLHLGWVNTTLNNIDEGCMSDESISSFYPVR